MSAISLAEHRDVVAASKVKLPVRGSDLFILTALVGGGLATLAWWGAIVYGMVRAVLWAMA